MSVAPVLPAEQVTPMPPAATRSPLRAAACQRIPSIDGLRELLQCAIELEHSTLPTYLCALYSLGQSHNRAAAEALESVFVEEMLHMTLVANLLTAVGGRPRLDTPEMVPGYPRELPHVDGSFELSLLPFGPRALQQFLRLERPTALGAPTRGDRYDTIGQFYGAIRNALGELTAELGETTVFCGDRGRQVSDDIAYRGGGHIIAIDDLASAFAALDEIVEQGEGASDTDVWDGDRDMFHPERDEVAHYYRIQELVLGRRYRRGDTPRTGPTGAAIFIDRDGVLPMQQDSRVADRAPGDPIRTAQELFNATYCSLLAMLDRAFDGRPETLGAAVGVMYELKAKAQSLMRTPTEDGHATAGLTFEYVSPEDRP